MIVVLTGQSGNGKSSWMVMEIKKMIEAGRPVFTIGIPKLKLPVIEWKRSQLRSWHEIELPAGYTLEDLEAEGAIYDQDGNEIPCPLKNLPDGAALFVDEGQKSWPPTGSKSTPDQLALSMHRHWGLDIYVASQSPRFLHQSLTENCSLHIHIHKTWRGSILLQFGECQANPTAVSIRETAYQKKYQPDPASFELYESASTHTKIKYGIPKRAIFAGFAFMLLPVAFYAIYHVIKTRAVADKKDPLPVASQPAAVTSPVRQVSENKTIPAAPQWHVLGYSKFNASTVFILQNNEGAKRYVQDPIAYKISGNVISLMLDGQLITNQQKPAAAPPPSDFYKRM